MDPEQLARKLIDQQLEASGWEVQDYAAMDLSRPAIAVREFPLTTGEADYLLYVDGKVIGVVEAKPEGHSLTGVETQSGKYLEGLPANLPHYCLPLPMAYESTGSKTRFTNYLEPHARSRPVFSFHRPEELVRLANLDQQVRTLLQQMPALDNDRLWRVQFEAIENLEESLAHNRPRSLIQMATGSGKTYTAVNACYRLIKHAKARRILFLVDRNNLGKQTLNEFQQFVSPSSSYKFTEEYNVQHLRRNTIDAAAKVCITTIQRLYSMLQGEDEFLEENEEGSLFEAELPDRKEALPVVYNPRIPIETFDFIIVDECHRSIYNLWRQVLDEYFDAFVIGLTATPTAHTLGFFNGNIVQEYTHEKAVADGVNVGYDVYRIETEVTAQGATLLKQPGFMVPHRDRRTKATKFKQLDDDLTYSGTQLDRDVVNKNQIRLIIRTFKDKLPEIFPGRTEVPKTLVFAKTDAHAEDIVEIIRDEFGRGNAFCQKITAKSHKPDELLQRLRTAYDPRIAVTVDMIATGTDVKPLECLIFMRDVRSLSYFEQMKGRGCRVVDSDTLKSVTSDAHHKTHFVIVDAIGVCESEKSVTRPLDQKPSVPLKKLLTQVAAGAADAETVSTLAARLARLQLRVEPNQEAAIAAAADGKSLGALCAKLLESIDPDAVATAAAQTLQLLQGEQPTAKQLEHIEHQRTRAALKPFYNPQLRDAILAAAQADDIPIDEVSPDTLRRAGFDVAAREKAQSLITSFRQFIDDHKGEIEALQILYSQPYRAGLRYSQVKALAQAIQQPPHSLYLERIWQAYEAIEPEKVQAHGGKQLVDVVALVRHVLDPYSLLAPIGLAVEERYEAWLAEQAAAGATFTPEQRKWLDAIKDHIATSLAIESDDLEGVPFNKFGGLGAAYELFGDTLSALLVELNARLAA